MMLEQTNNYRGAEAVATKHLPLVIKKYITVAAEQHAIESPSIQEEFLTSYQSWIPTTKLNSVKWLEQFSTAAYSNGTTESFDKFYLKHRTRRFRCFRGEYMYHTAAWRKYFPDWKYIDDAEIQANDAVVVSLPFSDFGNQHPEFLTVLDRCAELGVPVLVDCAYFGICHGIDFDFSHPAITDITFSLSKFLPVANLRIGMRLTKHDDDDSLLVLNKVKYVNRIGAAVGLQIINDFSPDYIVDMYRSQQITLCKQLDVTPSNTVIFGIDTVGKYPEYNRGTSSNRLNLSKYLAQHD